MGKAISVESLFKGYVELQQPATQRDLETLLNAKNSEASTQALKDLAADYADKVFKKRLSVLDILEDNKDVDLPLSDFLQMLPSMRIRQYSISSSPLHNSQQPSLTVSVVEAPAMSGKAEPFLGVASNFLAAYITIPIFLVLYLGHKAYYRTRFAIRVEDVDVWTGKKEMDDMCAADVEPVPRNWLEKAWFWLA